MPLLHLVRSSSTRDALRDNLALLAAPAGEERRLALPAPLVDASLPEGVPSPALECLVWVADGGRRWPARWAECRALRRENGIVTLELALGDLAAAEDGEPDLLPAREGRPVLAFLDDRPAPIGIARRPPDAGWSLAAREWAGSPAYGEAAFFRVVGAGPEPGLLTLQCENTHLREPRRLVARWRSADGLPREASRELPPAGEVGWTLAPPPAPGAAVRLSVEPGPRRSTQLEWRWPAPEEGDAFLVAEPRPEYGAEPPPPPSGPWALWEFLEERLKESQPPAFFIEALRQHFLPQAPDEPRLWERLAVWLAAGGQWEAAYRQLRALPAAELSEEACRVYLQAASQLGAEAPYEQLLPMLDFDTDERRRELAEALLQLPPARAARLVRQLVEQLLQPADALALLELLAEPAAAPELALPLSGWLAEFAGPERAYGYLLARQEADDLARRDPRVLARLLELLRQHETVPGAPEVLRLAAGRADPEQLPDLLALARQRLAGEALASWLAGAAALLGEREATRAQAAALWLDLARARRLAGDPDLAAHALRRAAALAADEEEAFRRAVAEERDRVARDLELLEPLAAPAEARRRERERRLEPRPAEAVLPRERSRGPGAELLADPHARALLEKLCGFAAVKAFQPVEEAAPAGDGWGLFLEPPRKAELRGWVRTPALPEGARFSLRTRPGAARLLYEHFNGALPLEAVLDPPSAGGE